MPKIVRFYETGGPEKLKIEDAPSQQPGAGEVRLRVELQDGRFKPVIAKVFPFQETVQAYQYMESNAQIGKIVIKVA